MNRFWILFIIFIGCRNSPELLRLTGEIMGTTYSILIPEEAASPLGEDIQAFLESVNEDVSTYESESAISRVNAVDSCIYLDSELDKYFIEVLKAAGNVVQQTNGYFDPTVGPLVDFWGFGVNRRTVDLVDTSQISRLKKLVNFETISLTETNPPKLCKMPGQKLDFNAIAKGYAVDLLCDYLKNKGYDHGLVEIGGETKVFGEKSSGDPWTIGINTPDPKASVRDLIDYLKINDLAVATSGDYRIFYESDGQRYVHIINPKTGFTEQSPLVSVTVIHAECMIADAYATGLLAMGWKLGLEIANRIDGLEAYFIYFDENGNYQFKSSSGFDQYLQP